MSFDKIMNYLHAQIEQRAVDIQKARNELILNPKLGGSMDANDYETRQHEYNEQVYSSLLNERIAYHIDGISQDVHQTKEFLIESMANLDGLESQHIHNLLETNNHLELGRFVDGLYREFVRNLARSKAKDEIV